MTGPEETMSDEHGHSPVISFVNILCMAFITGPTVYADMSFDALGKDANLCTAENHNGMNTASLVEEYIASIMDEPFESPCHAGNDSTAIDGCMSSGVDDKVGAVETALVTVHP